MSQTEGAVVLTPNELAFLQRVGRGDAPPSPLLARLSFPPGGADDEVVRRAGFQSLAARGLLRLAEEQVQIEASVGAVGAVLGTAERSVAIGLLGPKVEATRIVDGFGLRAVFAGAAPELSVARLLELEPDVPTLVAGLAAEVLETEDASAEGTATLLIDVELLAGLSVERGIAVRRGSADTYLVRSEAEGSAWSDGSPIDRDALIGILTDLLG